MTSRKISKISAGFFAIARKLTNISKWSCAKETLQDDQWKSLLSCFKSFKGVMIGEIMQQEIWMQFQTLVQQRVFPAPWRLCHLRKSDQQVSHHRTSLCCPTWPCRCLKWVGWWETWDNDSERFAMKVTESWATQNALNAGRIFPFSVAKKATFDRNFTNFRPLFGKIIQLFFCRLGPSWGQPFTFWTGLILTSTCISGCKYWIVGGVKGRGIGMREAGKNWERLEWSWSNGSTLKKNAHIFKKIPRKNIPQKSQLGMIRVPVISFTICYQWFSDRKSVV